MPKTCTAAEGKRIRAQAEATLVRGERKVGTANMTRQLATAAEGPLPPARSLTIIPPLPLTGRKAVGRELDRISKGFIPNRAEMLALVQYQGGAYTKIASSLRKAGTKITVALKKRINLLDAVIARSPVLERSVVVWRSGKRFVGKVLKPGTIIQDLSFVSTSVDAGVAVDFAARFIIKESVVLRITIPKGYQGVWMPEALKTTNVVKKDLVREGELLLGRGARFKVTGETREALTSARETLTSAFGPAESKIFRVIDLELLP